MEEPASLLRPDGVDPATVTLPSAGRVALLTACVTLGMLGGFALVRAVMPASDRTLPAHKLALIGKERPDTIFLGSSRVLRQIDPAVFDARMAARGFPAHSFNFGMPQMAVLEQEHVVPELFRRVPGIRYVILDPEFVEEEIAPQFIGTERIVAWHDLRATRISTVKILASDRTLREKYDACLPHWEAFVKRLSSFGEAHLLLVGNVAGGTPPFRPQELAARTHGFLSLDASGADASPEYRRELRARRRLLARALPEWKGRVERFEREITAEGPVPEAERQAVLRIQDIIRSHGAVPVFLISPGMFAHRNYLRAMRADGSIDQLVDLGDPARQPQFYDPANLFDPNHLNAAGATMFSRLLADVLASRIEAGEIPPPE